LPVCKKCRRRDVHVTHNVRVYECSVVFVFEVLAADT
jgi:hypothetical protein